jgi:feruloyl esterase
MKPAAIRNWYSSHRKILLLKKTFSRQSLHCWCKLWQVMGDLAFQQICSLFKAKIAAFIIGFAGQTQGGEQMTMTGPNRKMVSYLLGSVLLSLAAAATTPAAASSCASLANLHRPNTTITAAQVVSGGTFVTPTTPPQTLTGLPTFCRVAGFTTPTSDSHISFEVWIPENGWNRKYLQVGCGGFCGSISYSAMVDPLLRGYATAATDDGHESSSVIDASWAVSHPEKVIDYGYRAVKQTSDVAKDVIMAFEQSGPRRSYFMGCSDGGREALMEAQRYPNDFIGIVAGSPGNYWTGLMTGFLWDERALAATAAGDLTQNDLNTLSNAVLAKCVGHDGGVSIDNFLNNPPACRFNPAQLLCNRNNTSACLTPDKVTAVEQIYSGPPGIFPGYGPGGEANNALNWPLWLIDSGNPASGLQGLFAQNFFQYMVFPNSSWTLSSFPIWENAQKADIELGATLNSVDPNLFPFKLTGGKLIQYVGWSDTAISPQNDINYHAAVTAVIGGPNQTDSFYRLFMVPGMSHCGGGPGPNAFGDGVNGPNPADASDDVLSALDKWVEYQVAPEQIVATKYVNDNPAQGVAFQRPLCPYPKYASYSGHGPTTSAASFNCVQP